MNSPSGFLSNMIFYAVIGNNPSDGRKMRIPLAFWNDTKQALLPGPVFLKRRLQGPLWRVQLVQQEDSVHLRDGWAEFFKDNKLREGDLLLFTHLEGSDMLVEVCLQDEVTTLMPSGKPKRKEQPKPRGVLTIKEPTERHFVAQDSGARIQSDQYEIGGPSRRQKNKGKAMAYEDVGKKYFRSR